MTESHRTATSSPRPEPATMATLLQRITLHFLGLKKRLYVKEAKRKQTPLTLKDLPRAKAPGSAHRRASVRGRGRGVGGPGARSAPRAREAQGGHVGARGSCWPCAISRLPPRLPEASTAPRTACQSSAVCRSTCEGGCERSTACPAAGRGPDPQGRVSAGGQRPHSTPEPRAC